MPIVQFPNPRKSTSEGIVALGGDLEPESLLLAYSQGIFPWPMPEIPLAWFCPPRRAILEWKRLHIPRSLLRSRKKKAFRITIDRNFEGVIQECASIPRPEQEGTWITQEIQAAYVKLFKLGHAHSVEVWNGDRLVGGLYGVDGGGIFAGESMFHRESDASKLAILFLMEHLHERGLDWLDIQMLTPHMKALGARTLSRDHFLNLLDETRSLRLKIF